MTGVAAAAVSALVTLYVKRHQEQQAASLMARRAFYVELMTLLVSRRRATERLSTYPELPPPPDVDDERLNAFDALLDIDASPDVRRLAGKCFGLLNRFWASYTEKAPVEVDEHGLYRYRFDLVRNQGPEVASMALRLALGDIHDQLGAAMDDLARQVRIEVHGRKAGEVTSS